MNLKILPTKLFSVLEIAETPSLLQESSRLVAAQSSHSSVSKFFEPVNQGNLHNLTSCFFVIIFAGRNF
jgi:hypothetical protein